MRIFKKIKNIINTNNNHNNNINIYIYIIILSILYPLPYHDCEVSYSSELYSYSNHVSFIISTYWASKPGPKIGWFILLNSHKFTKKTCGITGLEYS